MRVESKENDAKVINLALLSALIPFNILKTFTLPREDFNEVMDAADARDAKTVEQSKNFFVIMLKNLNSLIPGRLVKFIKEDTTWNKGPDVGVIHPDNRSKQGQNMSEVVAVILLNSNILCVMWHGFSLFNYELEHL